MGNKGPLAIVSPADFKSRTALTLSSRSATTQAVDKAYEGYYNTRSPAAAKVLHDRPAEYMLAHGGSWARCERNVVSGGLMEYIYHSVAANALSPGQARAMDERAAARIRDIEIPGARFGVLYFLSGIKIDLDVAGSLIDGAGAIGGAIGVGMTTDFGQMKSAANGVRSVTSLAGKGVKAQDIATVGTGALHGTRMVGNKIMDAMSGPSAPGPSWLPCSEAALNAVRSKLSDTWDANHYASAIEHQMSLGILGGVAGMLKGASKVAMGVFLPGLGSLVSAVMSGIEWLVRLISRLGEYFGIQQFLQVARRHYTAEKQRAKMGADGVYEPNTAAGGIITDTAAFTTFFKDGCKASPLIPMLTLNSGLGGSLMTMLQLFEADGSQSARATRNVTGGETREFDRGDMYFRRLKRWSVEYMRKSGFRFLPADAKDVMMAGYLAHATGMGKERQSHVEAGTATGRVGVFLTA
jgi:hypothetical protein